MTKINSPGGFISQLKSTLKEATSSGKPVGAPTVQKALKGADAGKLSEQQRSQVRDAFEQAKLTPKAREVADRFIESVKQKASSKLPNDGILKVRMDDPLRGQGSSPGQGPNILVKVMADDPLRGQGPGSGQGPNILVKVMADDPLRGGQSPNLGPLDDGGIVKIVADDPLRGGQSPNLGPLDDGGIVKIVADDPLRGGQTPGLTPEETGEIVKIVADDPLRGGQTPGLTPEETGEIVKIIADDPLRGSGSST